MNIIQVMAGELADMRDERDRLKRENAVLRAQIIETGLSPDSAPTEREACAKVCELVAREIDDTNGTATYCANAIRARGEV